MSENEDWQSREAAQHYRGIADILIPGRKDILSTIAQLATIVCSEQPRILDLGCGYGDVTAEILKFRPHALAYMVDFSDEMMRIADERFKNYVNIKIFKAGENHQTKGALVNASNQKPGRTRGWRAHSEKGPLFHLCSTYRLKAAYPEAG